MGAVLNAPLRKLRARLDRLDAQLAGAFRRRDALVRRLGRLKAAAGLPLREAEREARRAERLGIPEDLYLALLRRSLDLQFAEELRAAPDLRLGRFRVLERAPGTALVLPGEALEGIGRLRAWTRRPVLLEASGAGAAPLARAAEALGADGVVLDVGKAVFRNLAKELPAVRDFRCGLLRGDRGKTPGYQ